MRRIRQLVLTFALAGITACGASGHAGSHTITVADIKSTDFALLPCPVSRQEAPCLLAVAGGKRLLFGTPSGLRNAFDPVLLASLDAVLLFSLQGPDLEGLDEVRNAGWTGGREDVLPVGGPAGTREVLAALNKAFEMSDAQIFVEAPPHGGFGAALLGVLPGEGDAKAEVFNTGDLVVTRIESADGRAGYWVDYGGRRAVLQPCGMDLAVRFNDLSAFVLGCEATDDMAGWPLGDVQYLVQGGNPEP